MYISGDVDYTIECFLEGESNYHFLALVKLQYGHGGVTEVDAVMQELKNALDASSLVNHGEPGFPYLTKLTKHSDSIESL